MMKWNKRYVFFLATILFVIGCSSSIENNKIKIYSIKEMVNTEKEIEFSQLDADIKYIPLEATDNSFIGPFIKKIITTDEFIYIFTIDRLFQFSIDGKFIRQISARGGAENEYGAAIDVFINPKNCNVYINDMYGKIMEFNSAGEYLKSYKENLSLLSKSVIMNKDSCLFESIKILSGNEPYKLTVRKFLNDTISYHLNNVKYSISEIKYSYGDSKSLFDFNGEIVYHQMSSDTVYHYNYKTHELDIRYLFENLTPSTAANFLEYNRIVVDKIHDNNSDNKDISLIYDIAEDKNYIYATIFTTSQGKQLYLISKKDGEYYKANFRIDNKLSRDLSFFPKWQEGNALIDYAQLDDESNPTIVIIQAK